MRTLRLHSAPRVDILGVGFDPVTLDGASELIINHIKTGAGFASVFTPNAVIVEECRKDKTGELAELFARSALSVPDGIGIIKAAKTLGTPMPERVAGIELAERLLELAAADGIPVFFLGGAEGVAESAAKMMQNRSPSLAVAGTHHGYFDKSGEENAEVLECIARSGAKLLFVCFGAPAQEKWIAEHANTLYASGVRCALGLGGSLDVWSGRVRRVPRLFRALGLEWLVRSLSLSRFSRIRSIIRFVFAVRAEKHSRKRI